MDVRRCFSGYQSGPALLALLAATLPLNACRTADGGGSAVKVTNGIETGNPPEIPMISVGTDAICTATFVNDTTLLTAAHCVLQGQPGGGIAVNGVKALKYFINPKFTQLELAAGVTEGTPPAVSVAAAFAVPNSPMLAPHAPILVPILPPGPTPSPVPTPDAEVYQQYDLAVIVFPPGTGQGLGITNYRGIAAAPPAVGTDVYINGYGNNNQPANTGAGVYRIGVNKIAEVDPDLIVIEGKGKSDPFANGQDAAPGSGDSGGPLLNGAGEILGTVSGGVVAPDDPNRWVVIYNDTTSATAKRLIASAIRCGAPPCAANFAGSGIAGANPGVDCLSAEEGLAYLLVVAAQQSGTALPADAQAQLNALTARYQQWGICGVAPGTSPPLLASAFSVPAAAAHLTPLKAQCIGRQELANGLKRVTAPGLAKADAQAILDNATARKPAGLCR